MRIKGKKINHHIIFHFKIPKEAKESYLPVTLRTSIHEFHKFLEKNCRISFNGLGYNFYNYSNQEEKSSTLETMPEAIWHYEYLKDIKRILVFYYPKKDDFNLRNKFLIKVEDEEEFFDYVYNRKSIESLSKDKDISTKDLNDCIDDFINKTKFKTQKYSYNKIMNSNIQMISSLVTYIDEEVPLIDLEYFKEYKKSISNQQSFLHGFFFRELGEKVVDGRKVYYESEHDKLNNIFKNKVINYINYDYYQNYIRLPLEKKYFLDNSIDYTKIFINTDSSKNNYSSNPYYITSNYNTTNTNNYDSYYYYSYNYSNNTTSGYLANMAVCDKNLLLEEILINKFNNEGKRLTIEGDFIDINIRAEYTIITILYKNHSNILYANLFISTSDFIKYFSKNLTGDKFIFRIKCSIDKLYGSPRKIDNNLVNNYKKYIFFNIDTNEEIIIDKKLLFKYYKCENCSSIFLEKNLYYKNNKEKICPYCFSENIKKY